MLELQPITLKEAHLWVSEHHRHHSRDTGALFAVAAGDGERILGVAVIGRPKARLLQDGYTAEVTRCCVVKDLPTLTAPDGRIHPINVASKLYSAAWRACRALGYKRLVTYTLKDEAGISLVASGWRRIRETADAKPFLSPGGSWDRPSRPRVDEHPTQEKIRWEMPSD